MAELQFVQFLNQLTQREALALVMATTYREWLREVHAGGVTDSYSQHLQALKQLFEVKFGDILNPHATTKKVSSPSEISHQTPTKEPESDPFEKVFGPWGSPFSSSDDEDDILPQANMVILPKKVVLFPPEPSKPEPPKDDTPTTMKVVPK